MNATEGPALTQMSFQRFSMDVPYDRQAIATKVYQPTNPGTIIILFTFRMAAEDFFAFSSVSASSEDESRNSTKPNIANIGPPSIPAAVVQSCDSVGATNTVTVRSIDG